MNAMEGDSVILSGVPNNVWMWTIDTRRDCFQNRSGYIQAYRLMVWNNADDSILEQSGFALFSPKNESPMVHNITSPVQTITKNPFWIRIDPVKNVTLGEPIFINGSTNFSAGELLTVSLTREITPGGGRECGKRLISIEMNTPVQQGYGLTNTWSTVLNTSEFCGGRSPTIAVWAVNHTQIIQYSSIIINDPIEDGPE
jgi:hypothetical protein